jgi:serine/threonine protein kinase
MLDLFTSGEFTTLSDERACPAAQELLEFVQGRALPAVTDRINRHLPTCLKCREAAARAGKDQTDRVETTRLVAIGGDPNSPEYDDERTPTFEVSEDFDLSVLSASQQVGSIGRLGDYEILGILGRGGYGIVFRAKDNTLGRPVAIKILEQGFAGSARSRRRFMREARAAAAVNHPNVVTIHAIEEHEGMPFLVMELVVGKSLRDWIRAVPKRDFMDILRIGAQVAMGLAAAHAQGVIHRDVKPANIMLEDGVPRVKITDFGLARVAVDNVEMTSRQIMVGTPAYMAPEQFRGEEVDARTDLFALGCVLYSMCVGHSPFHGRTVVEIAQLVNTFDPPNLADQDATVPRFLGDLIVRLLDKDPQKRFQSAAEVADVLNRHLTTFNAAPTDEIPRLIREGMRRETPPLSGRKPAIVAVALMSIAAGGWLAVTSRFWERSSGRPPAGTSQSGNQPDSGAQTSSPQSIPVPAIVPIVKSASVTVASDGTADFHSIGEGLAHVLPGGQVVVLDEGFYTDPIFVHDAAAFSGVRLIAQKRAVLKAPPPTTVVHLAGVPGFEISGFKITAAQAQHAIELTGENAGTLVHDVEVERISNQDPASSTIAAVYLHHAAAGSAEQPIRFDGLTIRDSIVGIVIGDKAPAEQNHVPSHIVLENSSILGMGEGSSTLLVLYPACQDVKIRKNILAKGLYGLSVLADNQHKPLTWEFTHNTCYRLSSFVAWAGPADHSPTFLVTHNLLYDVNFVAEELLEAASLADGHERFNNNLWVAPPVSSNERHQRLASFVDSLPLLSIDPESADFLRPDFPRLLPSVKRDPFPGRYGSER